jgi:hypothetical protein
VSLAGGDLTTPQRVATWMANAPTLPSPIISQLIGSMTNLIYSRLNRARIYNQTFTRTFDGTGTMQLVLPDYPVTGIISVQQGSQVIPASALPAANGTYLAGTSQGYGYRCPLWLGNLPGENAVLELVNGYFWTGVQNIRVIYAAGYLVNNESAIIPSSSPYTVTVAQQQGIWSHDNGVVYAVNGASLTPVASNPGQGQYIPPPDSSPGLYTFSSADEGAALYISYSFIPADLEEACIQMVAERYSYRNRVGDASKSLGGQETMRFRLGLPREVLDMIQPYVSVVPPTIGAPV